MKHLFYFLISFQIILLLGCSKEHSNSVVFMITNTNTNQLKNVLLKTSDNKAKTKEVVITSGKTSVIRLYMDQVSGDGFYTIIYEIDSAKTSSIQHSFGYYTNGSPVEDEILVTLAPDTLIVHSVRNY